MTSPIESIDAFPLCWPDGFPRTPARQRRSGTFRLSLAVSQAELREEVRKLGGRNLILSSNVPVRRDGGLYSNTKEPSDPGVAAYFDWDGQQRAMACDAYDRVYKNVRALALCIDALRALDRHGSSAILERAFRGFMALPAEGSAPQAAWWTVLGISHDATPDDIEDAYRRKALEVHPDKGGSPEAFDRVAKARDAALCAAGKGA